MAAGGTATGARRLQASLFLLCCCGAAAAPHRLPASQALWPATALTLLLGLYVLRAVFLPALRGAQADGPAVLEALPAVDLVVAARDEEAVIGRLVERLAALSYPADRLKIWIVDDGSEDRTPEVLSEYQARFPQLQVLRRPRDAGGGK